VSEKTKKVSFIDRKTFKCPLQIQQILDEQLLNSFTAEALRHVF